MNAFFVTGTNTEVGKTWVSCALLAAAARQGLRTIAIKPIAAGCERTSGGLRNEDALQLQHFMSEELSYSQVNPVTLEPAIAPHIAAQQAGLELSLSELVSHCSQTLGEAHDLALIEGAGGWRVPINDAETLADLPARLRTPVILVVGMGLGCLNHALLTVEAIERDGLPLAGWVANTQAEEMPCLAENLATLRQRLAAPCLGVIPYLPDETPQAAADFLDLSALLGQAQ